MLSLLWQKDLLNIFFIEKWLRKKHWHQVAQCDYLLGSNVRYPPSHVKATLRQEHVSQHGAEE